MNDSYCLICEKPLFHNGIRLTKLCYYIGAGCRRIDDNGWYADGTLGGVHICKECFTEKNKEKIIDVLFGKIFYGDEENRHTLVEVEKMTDNTKTLYNALDRIKELEEENKQLEIKIKALESANKAMVKEIDDMSNERNIAVMESLEYQSV